MKVSMLNATLKTSQRAAPRLSAAGFAAAAVVLLNAQATTGAFAQSLWGAEKTTTEKAKPAKKDVAEKADKKEPVKAADAAKSADAPKQELQTLEQLSKAGVKHCLQIAQAVGQATMAGTSEYGAASTWHSKQPDNRFSVSMIGQKFNSADNTISNGVSGVFSSPTQDGKCDAAAVQIIPTSEPCSKTQAQILEKGKSLGTLAGVAILQNAANAQIMLIPAVNNSCVLVALSTVYTE